MIAFPGWLLIVLHVMLQIAFIIRALLWPHREPASRMAWVTVITVTPVVGMLAYALLRRGQHRPPAAGAAAPRRVPAAAARRGRDRRVARPAARHAAPLRPALPRRHLDQRLRPGRRQPGDADAGQQPGDRRDGRRHRRRRRPRAHPLLHLASRRQRREGGRGAEARRGARRDLPRDGRRPRLAADDQLGALGGDAVGRRPAGAGAADRHLAGAAAARPHRHAQPPQDRGDRQPRHLLRQPELLRPGVPHQGEVRALGRRAAALRGADRAPAAAALRRRLDGAHRRGHRRSGARPAAAGPARASRRRRSAPARRCATRRCRRCSRR